MNRGSARIGLVGLVLTLMVGLAAATTAPTSASSTGTPLRSYHWSGYVAIACGTCQLRYVAASWTIPAVNCAISPPIAWDDTWVGLDGLTSGSVEQVGTASLCTNGQPDYLLWWQMYPDAATIPYEARPGDRITASVYYDSATHRYRLTLDDTTAGLTIDTSQPCPKVIRCGNADAEVISEAPAAGPTIPLADFGSTAYSSIRVTSRNGTRGGMASTQLWAVHPVTLIGATGRTLATPGPTTGTAFTDLWRAAQ